MFKYNTILLLWKYLDEIVNVRRPFVVGISEATGICGPDVVSTLMSLKMLQVTTDRRYGNRKSHSNGIK